MGMFDKPQYLTGKNGEGFVEPGDTFWLHAAKLEGSATISGETRPQAKLKVSRTKDSEQVILLTSGKAIVGQVGRMDASDRAAMPMELRLDSVPSGRGNPTHVLTPADAPPLSSLTAADDDIPF